METQKTQEEIKTPTSKKFDKSTFKEREWKEDIEGELDNDGFFITPNGSFWDQDYVYFNRDGFDKHGGRYDENGEYVPGEGWDDNLNCYESEKEYHNNEDDNDNDLDEGYTEEAMMKELVQFDDDDDLFEGKDLIKNDPNIEKVVKHENEVEKDEFAGDGCDEEKKGKINENNNNDNKDDDMEERESDEYEEIEDEEQEKEDNKEKDKIINIEKTKNVFVVKTKDGETFTINGNENKNWNKDVNNINIKNDKKEFKKNKYNNNYNKDDIEYEPDGTEVKVEYYGKKLY